MRWSPVPKIRRTSHPILRGPRTTGCRQITIKERENEMKKIAQMCAITLVAATAILAANNPMVGGHEIFPSKNIVQNALNSDDHTTLVAAVKAAGLVDTLEGPGPFTVFAPTNEAFKKLPPGTVESLVKPENKPTLTKILTYHVVPGRLSARELADMVNKGGGKAMLKTVEGDGLTVMRKGNHHLTLTDDKGDVATITIADVFQSNGVIHVVNSVMMP